MRQRITVLLLLILSLPAYAARHCQEFLGLWTPLSRTSLDIGLKIEGNKIVHIQNPAFLCCHHRDKPQVIQTDAFKVLDVPAPPHQIYLIVKEQEKGELPEYHYIELKIENTRYTYNQNLSVTHLNWDKLPLNEWEYPNIERFTKWLDSVADCKNCKEGNIETYARITP